MTMHKKKTNPIDYSDTKVQKTLSGIMAAAYIHTSSHRPGLPRCITHLILISGWRESQLKQVTLTTD